MTADEEKLSRLRIVVRGAVQGVGFRPFVYRLAGDLGLNGWVLNSGGGVIIEVEGPAASLEQFQFRLHNRPPPPAVVHSMETTHLDRVGYRGFDIRHSQEDESPTTIVLPDLATCSDCRREIFDRADRRYRYPFTNCTHCGPRYSIIEHLPYDRPHTSMKIFRMCRACQQEYDNPADRRFHAQPNACPECGPQLELLDREGRRLSEREQALQRTIAFLRGGAVVALKGLGGFQLLVDATNDIAVARLRRLKRREEKPFALMYPSLQRLQRDCHVDRHESRLLLCSQSPIVLLRRRTEGEQSLSDEVAPGNPFLGAMLPYTPLHILLMTSLGFPVVCTSGNLADEPICIGNEEALERLRGIADVFLVHDRPIVRHVDDSIVRVLFERELVLRRARGYAPLPVMLPQPAPTLLAVGAHLKNTIACSLGQQVFVSQHIGDLDTEPARAAFRRVIDSFRKLYQLQPQAVVRDRHPDYASTHHAATLGAPVVAVQHHFAHLAACIAENGLSGPVLGVVWDGVGYGDDGTIWGGEFLLCEDGRYTRVAHLRPFRLPGGEAAVREPRRSAVGALWEALGEGAVDDLLPPVQAFEQKELRVLVQMLQRAVNAPQTTSVGRLFDAVASLLDVRHHNRFEGQAAMELEWLATDVDCSEPLAWKLENREDDTSDVLGIVDWRPMLRDIIERRQSGVAVAELSAAFHQSLVAVILEIAHRAGCPQIAMTGGCFQSRLLTERAVAALRRAGFRPYWHQRIPPNDGGIAVGQIAAACWQMQSLDSGQ